MAVLTLYCRKFLVPDNFLNAFGRCWLKMAVLAKTNWIGCLILCLAGFTSAAQALEDVVLRNGLAAEIVYDGSGDSDATLKIGRVTQIAIDPVNNELYFGNQVAGQDDAIMIVNPATGEARLFPFFGNGLAFNADGSKFYFGLVNLMLGVWNRDVDEFRKFTILPGVEAVQVINDGSPKGRLLVANSDYGKNILGVDTVWEVDQNDGYYAPVMKFNEGSVATGGNFAALDAMAVDGAGNIHTLTGQGKVLILKADGSYVEGNTSPVTSSGLMQGGMGAAPDGVVYLQDTASGEVFATLPDGKQIMLAYGDAFEQSDNITDGGVASDGNSLYLINFQGKIIRIYATDGSSILSSLQTDLGNSVLNGVITDGSGMPLSGVSVALRDKSIAPVSTDSKGAFSFNVPAGLYHVRATLPNYGDFNSRVTAAADQSTDMAIAMASFLPGFLPAGLTADIIATVTADSIAGSSDVSFDIEGNLYSLNHSNGTITKTVLDTQSRDVINTFVAAQGGGMSNAWAVAIGDDLNLYASSSNSGLLRLPPADPDNPTLLTVDLDNPGIVRDQNGVDRIVSFVTDIDGVAKMSNGDIMMTSGSGGSIIDGFPEGTINSLIRFNPSNNSQTLFSRGIPAGGGDSVFDNPDVLKVDNQDVLYVTNRNGNAVSVDSQGDAFLHWPGDGVGYSDGLSSYTAFSPDNIGNFFLKGVNAEGVSLLRMIDPANARSLLTVASELSPSSGFGGFEFDPMSNGSSVVLSEWNFLLRIRTLDGRSIADNITSPPPLQPTVNPGVSLNAKASANAQYIKPQHHQEIEYPLIDTDTVNLPRFWTFARHGATSEPAQIVEPEPQVTDTSSGGGVLYYLIMLTGLIGVVRRQRSDGAK